MYLNIYVEIYNYLLSIIWDNHKSIPIKLTLFICFYPNCKDINRDIKIQGYAHESVRPASVVSMCNIGISITFHWWEN